MALVIPGHKWRGAVAAQSAEGTAASTAEYEVPMYSSSLKPMEDRADFEVADGKAFRPGQYKSRAWVEGTVEFAAFPDSAPRFLANHLGAVSDTVTGAGDPRLHTMVRKDTPQWHTYWVARPKADGTYQWEKYEDCIAKAFEWRYNSGQPLRYGVEILGKKATGVATAPSVTTTNVLANTNYGYSWLGATLKLDVDATPATTTIHNLESFVIRMEYGNAALVHTDDFFARYFDAGQWNLTFSATAVVEDWTTVDQTYYGAKTPSANTAHSPIPLSGAGDFTLNVGPTSDANRTQQIIVPAIQFTAELPDIDTSGAGLRVNFAGKVADPGGSTDPVTVKTKNAVATAYGG